MPSTSRNPYMCLRCSLRQLRKASTPTNRRQISFTKVLQTTGSEKAQSLPSIAPKPALDIKHIRHNISLHEKNCRDRNYADAASYPSKIESLFKQWQAIQSGANLSRQQLNKLEQSVGQAKAASKDDSVTIPLIEEARTIRSKLEARDKESRTLDEKIHNLAMVLPNLTSPFSPVGQEPKVLSYLNHTPTAENNGIQPPEGNPNSLSHAEIGSRLNLLDFASSSQTSGWGFYFLINGAALLEQALISYALHTCARLGYSPTAPPSLIYNHLAHLTGFQPRDAASSQTFSISQSSDDTSPPRSLSATAEIPLAGSKARTILHPFDLPIRVCAHSRSYRAEAGARGVDTKGLYRVHEFSKVEMFTWSLPVQSAADKEFNKMVETQKGILESLDLKCRVLEMPSSDLGASASRKIDIEAFFPSRAAAGIDDGWGEVSSASICTDYQSRRLETRLKGVAGFAGDGKFPWTLNGTALAVPRIIAAIMENGYDEKRGVVVVPEKLRRHMPGVGDEIGRNSAHDVQK